MMKGFLNTFIYPSLSRRGEISIGENSVPHSCFDLFSTSALSVRARIQSG